MNCFLRNVPFFSLSLTESANKGQMTKLNTHCPANSYLVKVQTKRASLTAYVSELGKKQIVRMKTL